MTIRFIDMDSILKTLMILTAMTIFQSCGADRNTDRDALMNRLCAAAGSGEIMYGHEDALLYGHGWSSDEAERAGYDRSDVKDVCGSHPAVLGLDLGGVEVADADNLDGIRFDAIRKAAVAHHGRGGVVTFSWHLRNPLTGGDSWDVSSDGAVAYFLENEDIFRSWMSKVADFLLSLKDGSGNPIPVIFRPWHEHTGSWFWWGSELCSVDEYKELWSRTYAYLVEEMGLTNLIWAYSPNTGVDAQGYMERYPGDGYVDILGFDCYQFRSEDESTESSNARYAAQLRDALGYITELGREHCKPIALTETGFEGIPYSKWWTEVLYPVINDYPIAYVLTWRNAWDRPGHFYGPFPGAVCEDDFKEFYSKKNIMFL